MNAPLIWQAFTIDTTEVHTFIVDFTTQNDKSESIIKIFENKSNGHKGWIMLKKYYEGQGIYANDISQDDTDLKKILYAGKKKPHMWWIEFEPWLNLVFKTYVKREGRLVHSDEMKIRTLLEMGKCE